MMPLAASNAIAVSVGAHALVALVLPPPHTLELLRVGRLLRAAASAGVPVAALLRLPGLGQVHLHLVYHDRHRLTSAA
jgi:hypothetical protein